MTIWVDVYEPDKILEGLHRDMKDDRIKQMPLPSGDYLILSSTDEHRSMLLERKSLGDFMGSVADNRIWQQLGKMDRKYDKELDKVLLLEGEYYQMKYRNWDDNSVAGIIQAIINHYKIPVYHARNKEWTINWLVNWESMLNGDGDDEKINAKRSSAVNMSTDDAIEYVLQGLAGAQSVKNLLEEFGSIDRLVMASKTDLQKVNLVGKKTADKIYTILHSNYQKGGKTL